MFLTSPSLSFFLTFCFIPYLSLPATSFLPYAIPSAFSLMLSLFCLLCFCLPYFSFFLSSSLLIRYVCEDSCFFYLLCCSFTLLILTLIFFLLWFYIHFRTSSRVAISLPIYLLFLVAFLLLSYLITSCLPYDFLLLFPFHLFTACVLSSWSLSLLAVPSLLLDRYAG